MRLRYLGLLVFIETPVILAITAAVTGQSILLFALPGLILGGASFTAAWVAESKLGAAPSPPTARLSRQTVLSKIRLSVLIAAPLVIFHGLLTGYNPIEWVVIPAFAALIAVVAGSCGLSPAQDGHGGSDRRAVPTPILGT